MKPITLLSDFLGGITLPHYLKKQEIGDGVSAEVVFDPSAPLEVGHHVAFIGLEKNVRIFEIVNISDTRKAKGDWSFKKVYPKWCKIQTKHIGFYDDIKEEAVPDRITL